MTNQFEQDLEIIKVVSFTGNIVVVSVETTRPPGARLKFMLGKHAVQGKVVDLRKNGETYLLSLKTNSLTKATRAALEELS